MFTHSIARVWSNKDGIAITSRVSADGAAEVNIDEVIPAATTQPIQFQVEVAKIKCLFLCSKSALTVTTNSPTAPVNTFSLQPGQAFIWITGDAPLHDTAGNPVTGTITSLYVANAAAESAANLSVRLLFDPTP